MYLPRFGGVLLVFLCFSREHVLVQQGAGGVLAASYTKFSHMLAFST